MMIMIVTSKQLSLGFVCQGEVASRCLHSAWKARPAKLFAKRQGTV